MVEENWQVGGRKSLPIVGSSMRTALHVVPHCDTYFPLPSDRTFDSLASWEILLMLPCSLEVTMTVLS